jgi:hypothetical protein
VSYGPLTVAAPETPPAHPAGMDTIAELERTAAVHEATRAELKRGPWTRRRDSQMADLSRLAWECRRKAEQLRRMERRAA